MKKIKKVTLKGAIAKAVNKAAKPKKVKQKQMRKERKVSVPVGYGSAIMSGAPLINGGKPFTIRHCEYLQQIVATIEPIFTPIVYSLNPGLTDSFPWLGQFGALFEQYRFKFLRFWFKTRSPSNSSGDVIMATQYDSSDPEFADKIQMLGYAGAVRSNVWMDLSHNCNLKRGDYLKKYYCRSAPLSTGADPQVYDVGNFTIACQSDSALYRGDLMVEYEVEFFNPKVPTTLTAGYGAEFTIAGTPASPFTTFTPVAGNWQPEDYLAKVDGNTVTVAHPGAYLLTLSNQLITGTDVKATGITSTSPAFTDLVFSTSPPAVPSAQISSNYAIFVTAAANVAFDVVMAGTATAINGVLRLATIPIQWLQALLPSPECKIYSEEQRMMLLKLVGKHSFIRDVISAKRITPRLMDEGGDKWERKEEQRRSRSSSPKLIRR